MSPAECIEASSRARLSLSTCIGAPTYSRCLRAATACLRCWPRRPRRGCRWGQRRPGPCPISRTAELIDLYRRADIFALPSRGDCLPQVLAEAAAAGLPLVATPTGAVPEIVRDGENGFLVPIGSIARLASVLRLLVDDPALRRRMGRESMVMAAREHDAAANNLRIFDLMAAAAGRAESARAAGVLSEVS